MNDETRALLTDATICEIFMSEGFTVKEGQTDLKPYVYAAAHKLIAAALAAQVGARGQATEGEAMGSLLQRLMSRLAGLLDDDQFNEIDAMVSGTGYAAPTPQAAAPGALPAVMTQNPLRPDEPADEQHSRARYVSGWNACHAEFTTALAAPVAPGRMYTQAEVAELLKASGVELAAAVQPDRAALVAEAKRLVDGYSGATCARLRGESSTNTVLECRDKCFAAIDRLGASTAAEPLTVDQVGDWVLPGKVREQGEFACLMFAIRETEKHHGIGPAKAISGRPLEQTPRSRRSGPLDTWHRGGGMSMTQTYEERMAAKEAECTRKRHERLGAAIERACAELPEDYHIQVIAENGSGWVELYEVEDCERIPISDDCEDLAEFVISAIACAQEHAASTPGTANGSGEAGS